MSSPTKQKHFSPPKFYSLRRFLCFLTTFTTLLLLLLLLQFHSLPSSSWPLSPSSSSSSHHLNAAARAMLRDSVTFLPLKDLRFADAPMSGHTWFMSSMNDTFDDGEAEYLHFPSKESAGRVLCLAARDVSDGAKNSYALAWPEALPRGATLYQGLTFVSDTYYDYTNLWHGLSAVAPFMSWHQRRQCAVPARWVLFHRGELRTEMSPWVRALAEAAIGSAAIEGFEGVGGEGGGPACFEEAVVFRHNMGAMSRERAGEVTDMMRCRARAYCNVGNTEGVFRNSKRFPVRMTLLLRTDARSFKNESAVVAIFETECRKVDGCSVKVERPDKLTFCDQVKLMSETDILVSPHGAQMTNMIFMNKNSRIMEFFPNGWKELAGEGQYVFQWVAEWSEIRHRGSWYDPEAVPCMTTGNDRKTQCPSYKTRRIGHDQAYFAQWAARVLQETKDYKLSAAAIAAENREARQGSTSCQCLQA